MFKTLRNALKVKDIRNGLLFTFFILIVIRFGSMIPVPVNMAFAIGTGTALPIWRCGDAKLMKIEDNTKQTY